MEDTDRNATESLEAANWERGCRRDRMRNDFLIPSVARVVEAVKPASILDVGCGTGYVARAVDKLLVHRPSWTLLDQNQARLNVAMAEKQTSMAAEIICVDVDSFQPAKPYGAVFLTFTLLEFDHHAGVLAHLAALTGDEGIFVIALPDVWRDVLEFDKQDPKTAAKFLQGSVTLSKVDKFTGLAYPFHAHRIEQVIARILRLGFALELLEQGGARGEAFLLVFRKLRVSDQHADR
jgi:ubiquinone/menaquinone biosynthesis C-methylase UbiE